MTDAKMAIKIIESADYVIPYQTIRQMIKWDDDVEEDQFSQYSESQWVWVNQERATLKRAIRSRLRRGIFALKYCPKGDSQWYDSPRNFRGNSPAPKFMSFQVGIGKGHLQD